MKLRRTKKGLKKNLTALACLGEVLVAHVWFSSIMYTVRRQLGGAKICFLGEKIAMCVEERKLCAKPQDLGWCVFPCVSLARRFVKMCFGSGNKFETRVEKCGIPCVSSAWLFVKMRFGNGDKFGTEKLEIVSPHVCVQPGGL